MSKGVGENTLWNLKCFKCSHIKYEEQNSPLPNKNTRAKLNNIFYLNYFIWTNYQMEKIIRKGSNLHIWLTNFLCKAQEK